MELKVLTWNIRGMGELSKKLEFLHFLDTIREKPQIICIQETKMHKHKEPPKLAGYVLATYISTQTGQGGVAIYIMPQISYIEIKLQQPTNMQVIAVQIKHNAAKLTLVNCYTNKPCKETFEGMEQLDIGWNSAIIVGDFNTKHPDWNPHNDMRKCGHAEKMVEWMGNKNLSVNNPRMITREGLDIRIRPSTLDLVINGTRWEGEIESNRVNQHMGSDHHPVIATIKGREPPTAQPKQKKLKLKQTDWEGYAKTVEALPKLDLSKTLDELDKSLTEQIQEGIKENTPVGTTNAKSFKRTKGWWSEDCKETISERECKRKDLFFDNNDDTFREYIVAREIAKQTITEAKKEHWNKFTESLGTRGNATTVWKEIGKLRNSDQRRHTPTLVKDGVTFTENKEKAQVLAETYAQVASTESLTDQFRLIKQTGDDEVAALLQTQNLLDEEGYNARFRVYEFERALQKCKDSAPGRDQVNYQMLKKLPDNKKREIIDITNKSWTEGQIPREWKIATIVPIPKPGKDKHDPKSYRPISLTSCLSKVIQRMIKQRLTTYVEKSGKLSPLQAGGRPNRSCEDHLVSLEHEVRQAFAIKKHVLAIFLDLANAYDRTWNNGIVKSISKIGIKGRMLV